VDVSGGVELFCRVDSASAYTRIIKSSKFKQPRIPPR